EHGDWKKQNLERLLRSFKKELLKRQIIWQASDFDHVQKSYTENT
ncbi:3-deoxy-D-manno-octulosonic acid kinase, partial [Vibrio parahaemolyticus]|nr:3-deoxy-D-manno-octulosonic acid kinase [Vibrio parahaemolyticus]MCX8824735.1 3-deoxy-D-manno-octulosonic acid kinase [Vibrio parahaemolyticus]MCX8829933.1 3-deoxy-D-manno-octulosonic acid kinase [Vibrio parahaemolyticus]MCX8835235.1 3-deoxy-D-manno-octulosonic acid kinase [Vibrio parahaemolyticus]MCX8880432.1 3-deoxy-D-manno-octulosonic acid kinase [Vibrio parahaemolyticus]